MENKITTYGYVFSHTHVTKNDICSAVLVLYCCSQSECSPVLFKYLDHFLTKWHCIVYRWKAIVNVYLNIGVGQEWQNTIPEGLTSIHLTLGE